MTFPDIIETHNNQGWKKVAENRGGEATVNQPKYELVPATHTCGVSACTELIRTLSKVETYLVGKIRMGRVKNERHTTDHIQNG